jgi:hypothetical protein
MTMRYWVFGSRWGEIRCRTLTYDLRTALRRRWVTGEKPCQRAWDLGTGLELLGLRRFVFHACHPGQTHARRSDRRGVQRVRSRDAGGSGSRHREISRQSDGPALRRRRVHQLADRREDGGDSLNVLGELFVQARLELREALGQVPVGAQCDGCHDRMAWKRTHGSYPGQL